MKGEKIMTRREYIGARYVPKMFDYNGSNNWVSGISYEPLVVVTYMQNSYTSKKPVPSNVGNPASNPEYWVNTGNYTGIVSDLTVLVNNLRSDFDNLEDSLETHAIYVGNSYTNGAGSVGNDNGIYERTKSLFTTAIKVTEGGTGFATYTGHSTTFNTLLLAKAAQMTEAERNKITHIMVVSAYGDTRVLAEATNYGYNWLRNAITTFIGTRNTYFPNAKIYITLAEGIAKEGISGESSSFRAEYAIHDMFRILATELDYQYMGWIGWEITHWATMFATDGIHPNDNGYLRISNAFIDAFKGNYHPTVKQQTLQTTLGGDVRVIGTQDETQLVFGRWDSAGTVGDITLIDFSEARVIPAFKGDGGASKFIEAVIYENRDDMSPSRFTLNTIGGDYSVLKVSGNNLALTSGHNHIIQSPILIKHTWE